jgi:2-dehydro-3-deoxygluconokinase
MIALCRRRAAWGHTRLLHISGITAALGASCRALCADAIRLSRASGALAIFDVNYRAKLWPPAEARAALTPLIRACSLLLCGRADAELIFGASGEPQAITASLQQQLGVPVVVTLGANGSCARDAAGQFVAVAHPATTEVDRVGAGDAFASGLIYGLLKHNDLAQALPYGGALAALKLTVHGDVAWVGRNDLEALVGGGDNTAIRR